ncbi:MAG TPA: MTH1187 family thiamine-binding protein [Candidatus Bathyarchaeia archaeon]|nr:MTH1187 family thiamine-binding protein [Candidatus Bathyarchaeia archaeon]
MRAVKQKRIVSIAEFSIHPIGKGVSVSPFVKRAIQAISKIKDLKYEVTPMATILEAEKIQTILRAVEAAHSAVRAMGAKRISSTLRIDERLDKPRTMNDKTSSVVD